jgi:hypothetical protein
LILEGLGQSSAERVRKVDDATPVALEPGLLVRIANLVIEAVQRSEQVVLAPGMVCGRDRREEGFWLESTPS